jgi:membrane protease YdiL (CAAX protease family)
MFYRGFVQNEFQSLTDSPLASITLTSIAFAFSHQPGDGRYTAGMAGAYLGYLAFKNHGQLGPGIALHFWSSVILGVENILLNAKGQSNTPPGVFSVQVPF